MQIEESLRTQGVIKGKLKKKSKGEKTKLVSHFGGGLQREEEESRREEEEEEEEEKERYGMIWFCMETICVWIAMGLYGY